MAAPILWAPGIFLVLSAGQNCMPIKFLVSGGRFGFFVGVKCQFHFMGTGIFRDLRSQELSEYCFDSAVSKERDLTRFCVNLGELREKLSDIAMANNRQKTH